eukprot:scaffold191656_cov30-Tisochrysis_lutea.AAC.1
MSSKAPSSNAPLSGGPRSKSVPTQSKAMMPSSPSRATGWKVMAWSRHIAARDFSAETLRAVASFTFCSSERRATTSATSSAFSTRRSSRSLSAALAAASAAKSCLSARTIRSAILSSACRASSSSAFVRPSSGSKRVATSRVTEKRAARSSFSCSSRSALSSRLRVDSSSAARAFSYAAMCASFTCLRYTASRPLCKRTSLDSMRLTLSVASNEVSASRRSASQRPALASVASRLSSLASRASSRAASYWISRSLALCSHACVSVCATSRTNLCSSSAIRWRASASPRNTFSSRQSPREACAGNEIERGSERGREGGRKWGKRARGGGHLRRRRWASRA